MATACYNRDQKVAGSIPLFFPGLESYEMKHSDWLTNGSVWNGSQLIKQAKTFRKRENVDKQRGK